MVYSESIIEMIDGNTQNCIKELQDIKKAMELLLERAGNIIPEDTPTADNNNEIKEKKEALVEKIESWDSHDNIYELAQWFNELRELVGDDEIDIPYLSGNCFQMDLYHRIEAIFPLITCNIDGGVLYQPDQAEFCGAAQYDRTAPGDVARVDGSARTGCS